MDWKSTSGSSDTTTASCYENRGKLGSEDPLSCPYKKNFKLLQFKVSQRRCKAIKN